MHTAFWLRVGAIWGFLAVAMGAFGAHGLQDRFRTLGNLPGGLGTERLTANFHTAAQYHMYCALALLVVGVLALDGPPESGSPDRRLVAPRGLSDLFGKPVHPVHDGAAVAGSHHADRGPRHAGGLARARAGGGINCHQTGQQSDAVISLSTPGDRQFIRGISDEPVFKEPGSGLATPRPTVNGPEEIPPA